MEQTRNDVLTLRPNMIYLMAIKYGIVKMGLEVEIYISAESIQGIIV